jgi:hypothetical protein
MFMFAVLLVHVTQKVAMRTLQIRAKSFGVPLLAAVSALVVLTSVISMRTVATVPARFAHRNVATNKYNSDNGCCQCGATQSRNERIPLAKDIRASFQIVYKSF